MPWKIRTGGGPTCPYEVVRADTGAHVACHKTRKQAIGQLRALYASEPSARKATTIMDAVTKSVEAEVRPIESDHPNGEFEVILSTEERDRDGENLWIDEWKQPLPARIHIDGDHNHSIEKTVGSVVPHIEGDLLIGKGTYAPTEYAQMVRQIVNDKDAEGHGLSLSVTYTEKKTNDGGVQRELLKAAMVTLPSNPEAAVVFSKAAKTDSDEKPKPLTAGSRHADPGYLDRNGQPAKQGNGVPRYQIDDAAHARNALARFSQNRTRYSPAQQKLILGRIRAAARKFGVEVAEDNNEKAFGAGTSPRHDDMVQAIHDAAAHLGAQCQNAIEADTGEDEGANKTIFDDLYFKTSSLAVGSPQLSAEESAAADTTTTPVAVSAAADESAENVASQALAQRARSLAFLMKHTTISEEEE